MRYWMFDCREISRLVSISMDRELALRQHAGLRLHLMMCRYCARYRRQLLFLRELMRRYSQRCDIRADDRHLSAESRERISEKLRKAATGR